MRWIKKPNGTTPTTDSRFVWHLRATLKKVWVRVISFALLSLLAAVLARILSPYLPENIALQTGSEAVTQLLGILTSSMLAVTTFSLSIAVSAFAAAANSATPRATVLLQQDRTTQNVLSTFLGAFLFGLVGLIALHAEVYDASGKVVVFLFTVIVIGLVVMALIRWISHLMQFGRMADTLDRVEKAASDALEKRLENPFLGGRQLVDEMPDAYVPLTSAATGYVQHIDMNALQSLAEKLAIQIYIMRLPGSFVAKEEILLCIEGEPVEETDQTELKKAVTIGNRRTFDDDPRFGLIVLTEIASRALSPSVNDPGTAIDILGRHARILSQWRDRSDTEILFDRVFVLPIKLQDAIEDAFRPIARDGASLVEVQIRLQKVLFSLMQVAPKLFAQPCENMVDEALKRAEAASLVPLDIAVIRSAAQLIKQSSSDTPRHPTTLVSTTGITGNEI